MSLSIALVHDRSRAPLGSVTVPSSPTCTQVVQALPPGLYLKRIMLESSEAERRRIVQYVGASSLEPVLEEFGPIGSATAFVDVHPLTFHPCTLVYHTRHGIRQREMSEPLASSRPLSTIDPSWRVDKLVAVVGQRQAQTLVGRAKPPQRRMEMRGVRNIDQAKEIVVPDHVEVHLIPLPE